jgi:hypothetical protein
MPVVAAVELQLDQLILVVLHLQEDLEAEELELLETVLDHLELMV